MSDANIWSDIIKLSIIAAALLVIGISWTTEGKEN